VTRGGACWEPFHRYVQLYTRLVTGEETLWSTNAIGRTANFVVTGDSPSRLFPSRPSGLSTRCRLAQAADECV